MKRPVVAVAVAVTLLVLSASGCRSSRTTGPAGQQEDFGVRMAKMNLWREAMFRFKRAVELNPDDAMAHNNLAVAYEANGDFENAGKAYREAMRLDKSNQHIQKNYSRFVEFTTRDRRRQQRRPATQAATAATTPAAEPTAPASVPATPAERPAAVDEPAPAGANRPDATPATDPSPAAASPAETAAPNPASPQPVPQPAPNPPGGQS